MKRNTLNKVLFLVVSISAFLTNVYSQNADHNNNDSILHSDGLKNSVAIKPIDLFVSIYAIQYERQVGKKNEMILGLYYIGSSTNEYPGTFKLYSPMIGYRRYLWKGLHVEYILLPGYAKYNDTIVKKIYNSFEVWNEFHVGYRFEFKILKMPFFITPQVLTGFSLYKSNQPQSFKLIDDKPENYYTNVLYIFPNINIGVRF